MKLAVKPLTPERWDDLESIFKARGCSVARGCWCMFYRRSGEVPIPGGMTRSQVNRKALRALAKADPPAGLIGYQGKTPMGWISLGPREDFRKLEHSPVMKAVDDAKVWSIVCFVVPSEFRRSGVASALLAGAIGYARRRKVRILEAYPVDKREEAADDSLWFGTKSMYDAAGFIEVARRRPRRPVVRLELR